MAVDSAFPFKNGDMVTIEVYDEDAILVHLMLRKRTPKVKQSSPAQDKSGTVEG
jgi:hypothetical protein